MTMIKNILYTSGGIAVMAVALAALPSPPGTAQQNDSVSTGPIERRVESQLASLQGKLQEDAARLAQDRALLATQSAFGQQEENLRRLDDMSGLNADNFTMLVDGDGTSWLGVEAHEVTSDKVNQLKLPAERGVIVGRVTPDSPAAKAGLKENDVITEIDGQRVEGAAQFRRMIREIPAGRSVQLTIWREGHSQTISATLAKAEEGRHTWSNAMPGSFNFHMPDIPIPQMEWGDGFVLPGGHPRLGIDAEDLNGQLGAYFGVPDGEGVLVRAVNAGSPAEKAGIKAGDVITTVDGERIRSLGDLREKLSGKKEEKQAKLGVLRNKNELSVTVELPAPAEKSARMEHRTNI